MKQTVLPLFIALAATTALAEPLVFDVTMTVKTTVAKKGKIASSCVVSNGTAEITYRKQGTIKVQGLIWGCKCESLIGPLGYTKPSNDGCYFWNVTDKAPLVNGSITWPVLHRIDNRMKKAEGVMDLSADGWYLLCAGFGRAESLTDSIGRLVDLKGFFAGWRLAPVWTKITYGVPCSFCESGIADETEILSAQAWALCTCAAPTDKTAAFGNWMIKYNRDLSLRLNDATEITAVYSFPTYVLSAMTATPAPAPAPAAETTTPAAETTTTPAAETTTPAAETTTTPAAETTTPAAETTTTPAAETTTTPATETTEKPATETTEAK